MHLERLLQHVAALASIPTAPYNEQAFAAFLHTELEAKGIRFKTDPHGHTMARIRRQNPSRQLGLVAHMDQPVLRVVSVEKDHILCVPQGALPVPTNNHTKVVFPQAPAEACYGTVVAHTLTPHTNDSTPLLETVSIAPDNAHHTPKKHAYATYTSPPLNTEASLLSLPYSQHILTSAVVLHTLQNIALATEPVDIWALFTRGDQLNMQGSTGAAIGQLFPRGTWVVGIQTSHAYARIHVGEGPVVKTGTPHMPFDRKVTALLNAAARTQGLPCQHALLNDPLCSAEVFTLFGYASAGLGIPIHIPSSHSTYPMLEESSIRDLEHTSDVLFHAALRCASNAEDADVLRNNLILESEQGRLLLKSALDPETHYPEIQYF